MATFPSGIIGTGGLPVIIATEPTNNPSHTAITNTVNGEVIAIETALGVNVAGTYGTVAVAVTAIAAASSNATLALATAATALTTAAAAQTTANTAVAAASAAQTTATAAIPKAVFTGNGVLLAGTATSGSYVAIAAPGTTGYLLSAGTATVGGMQWVAPSVTGVTAYPGAGVAISPGTGGPWSASLTVGTAASNLVQLTTAGALPAVSAVNLTGITSVGVTGIQGAWNTSSYAAGSIYQAGTDGYVVAFAYAENVTTAVALAGYTDTSNTPTSGSSPGLVSLGRAAAATANAFGLSMGGAVSSVFPVKKNNYWEVVLSGSNTTCSVYWIALGS